MTMNIEYQIFSDRLTDLECEVERLEDHVNPSPLRDEDPEFDRRKWADGLDAKYQDLLILRAVLEKYQAIQANYHPVFNFREMTEAAIECLQPSVDRLLMRADQPNFERIKAGAPEWIEMQALEARLADAAKAGQASIYGQKFRSLGDAFDDVIIVPSAGSKARASEEIALEGAVA
jgi:hypothetical protein